MSWKNQRGTRQERGYGVEYGRARAVAMERDRHLCQPCARAGRVTVARECDHIVPKHKGGSNDPANLQAICSDCHKAKTEAEAADAQGRAYKPKLTIGADGWPE